VRSGVRRRIVYLCTFLCQVDLLSQWRIILTPAIGSGARAEATDRSGKGWRRTSHGARTLRRLRRRQTC
jgi:hypothetical protein